MRRNNYLYYFGVPYHSHSIDTPKLIINAPILSGSGFRVQGCSGLWVRVSGFEAR